MKYELFNCTFSTDDRPSIKTTDRFRYTRKLLKNTIHGRYLTDLRIRLKWFRANLDRRQYRITTAITIQEGFAARYRLYVEFIDSGAAIYYKLAFG